MKGYLTNLFKAAEFIENQITAWGLEIKPSSRICEMLKAIKSSDWAQDERTLGFRNDNPSLPAFQEAMRDLHQIAFIFDALPSNG